jgi:hypothetical protein
MVPVYVVGLAACLSFNLVSLTAYLVFLGAVAGVSLMPRRRSRVTAV